MYRKKIPPVKAKPAAVFALSRRLHVLQEGLELFASMFPPAFPSKERSGVRLALEGWVAEAVERLGMQAPRGVGDGGEDSRHTSPNSHR